MNNNVAEVIDSEGSTPNNSIIKTLSVANLLSQRNAAVERIEKARTLLVEAREIMEAGHLGNLDYMMSSRYRDCCDLLDDEGLGQFEKAIDASAWEYLMQESGILSLMDATALAKWRESLKKREYPELTPENITSTFQQLHEDRGEIFERGVIECFKRLSWDYKTNQPQKFGDRIIMNYFFDKYFLNHRASNELSDLLRVFCVLDGQPEPDYKNGVWAMVNEAQKRNAMEAENKYFKLKWFKKGSCHVTFKRPDFVDALNKILAKHYPDRLGR